MASLSWGPSGWGWPCWQRCVLCAVDRPAAIGAAPSLAGSRSAPGSGRAGAEAGEDVVAVGRVEIAEGVAEQAGPRGPAASPQHFLLAERGGRGLRVGVELQSRVGLQGVGGPFPNVAEHLPAAEGAVAGRGGPGIHAAPGLG